MPFNGSGVFQRVRNWVADATAGVKIRADFHDSEDDGFAAGLTNCITKDGQTTITQNIPFNNKRITGLADPVNPQDAATKASVTTLTSDKLPLTGGTMTGDLTVKKDGAAITLNGTSAAGNNLHGLKSDKQRWLMRLGNDAVEAAGNVGSDFDLHRYANDGAYLGQALNISRADGKITLGANGTAANHLVDKGYIDGADGARVLKAGDTWTGNMTTAPSGGLTQAGAAPSLQITGSDGNAVMSFHIPGAFGTNFGLATDGNFWFGGWSHGSSGWRLWSTRDFASVPTGTISNLRLAYAGDWAMQDNVIGEPYPGAVATGGYVGRYGDFRIGAVALRFRYLQAYTGSWWTVGYA